MVSWISPLLLHQIFQLPLSPGVRFKRISGTSIGFKNIASKIAYDLRLWLNRHTSANNNNTNNCNNNQLIATTKNNQSVSSMLDIENAPPSEDMWSFDSGDDVIEISLSECSTPAKAVQDIKKWDFLKWRRRMKAWKPPQRETKKKNYSLELFQNNFEIHRLVFMIKASNPIK